MFSGESLQPVGLKLSHSLCIGMQVPIRGENGFFTVAVYALILDNHVQRKNAGAELCLFSI